MELVRDVADQQVVGAIEWVHFRFDAKSERTFTICLVADQFGFVDVAVGGGFLKVPVEHGSRIRFVGRLARYSAFDANFRLGLDEDLLTLVVGFRLLLLLRDNWCQWLLLLLLLVRVRSGLAEAGCELEILLATCDGDCQRYNQQGEYHHEL